MDGERWDRVGASPELRRRPVAELITGLDALRGRPIPYESLPRRAKTAYGNHFRTWPELADETVESLLGYPKAGSTTVGTLLRAAERAVADAAALGSAVDSTPGAAIRRLLRRLGDLDRAVLSARTWALDPELQHVVAARVGANARTLVRSYPRMKARFAELVADPAHQDVSAHAADLRDRIGPLVPLPILHEVLAEFGLDLDEDAGRALLFVAGPFQRHGDWVRRVDVDGPALAARAVDEFFLHDATPTSADLVDALGMVGMPSDAAAAYVDALTGVRLFGDRWVRWGDSIADKGWAVLKLRRTPLTVEAFAEVIGDGHVLRSIPEALSKDDRFHRTTRRSWALREWGLPEYGGIVTEIGARIDAAGGRVPVADVVADVLASFPDVAEKSVRSYATMPVFVAADGWLRRRTSDDPWPAIPDIQEARGAYLNGPNEIRLAVPVTGELLRGSGQRIHPAIVAKLGPTPGATRTFAGPCGDVTMHWRLDHPGGPLLGSLRVLALHVGANLGDELLLIFDGATATLKAIRIPAGEHPRDRLRQVVGRTVRNPIAALARSLDCPRDQVPRVLRRRGENDLLALVGP